MQTKCAEATRKLAEADEQLEKERAEMQRLRVEAAEAFAGHAQQVQGEGLTTGSTGRQLELDLHRGACADRKLRQ